MVGVSLSSVSPEGQVTIPLEMRRALGLKPKDKGAFRLEGGVVTIVPVSSPLKKHVMSVPALDPPRSLDELFETAGEEYARPVAREGTEAD